MATPSNRVRTTDKAVKRVQSLTPRTICLVFANKRRRSGDAKMTDCIRATLAVPLPASPRGSPLIADPASHERDMDDSTRAAYTEITVRIPDDLARRLGTGGEVERRVLEALVLDEFRQGHLSRAELRQLLGFATRGKLDEFLTAHGVFGTYTPQDLEHDRRGLQRLGF
jgi:Uncharacterised protein family (UPF0175)